MNIRNILTRGSERSVAVKKNILGALIIKGISIVVSLLLVPMTLGYVSSELYGIWLTLSSVMLWLQFFDVGFTLGLKNKLAEAVALEDYERGRSLVSTTYMMMGVIFIPLCIVLELLVPYIDWASFLNVDQKYNPDIINAMYVLVACFCLQMFFNVLGAVVAAFQKVALSSAFMVMGNVLSLVAIFLMTKFVAPSLEALAFAISTMPIVVLAISSFMLYRGKFKAVAPSLKSVDKQHVRAIFGLGAKFFLIQIQIVVLFQATNILISNVAGPNDVTSYNIANKYLSIAMMVYTIILSPLWPAFTNAYTKKDFTWMNNIYHKMVRVYAVSAGAMILMIIVSPWVYSLWIGDKAEIPFAMTLSVGIYMLFNTWDSLQVMLINGIGAVKLQSYVTMIGLILHIPLSLLLGKYIGALGVVCSMSIVTIIYLSFFTVQINKILKQKAKGIWIK